MFIHRPVATTLLTLAIALAGILGFRLLPVTPPLQVDFPVIMVSASLPGASPETMRPPRLPRRWSARWAASRA
ncbi:efflux RND transporter permease subunit [Pantoea ananatis]